MTVREIGCIFLALFAAGMIAFPANAAQRPNIILFFVDDLGWGDISLHGNQLIKTPNIDRIGTEGVTMTQFYSGSNVCSPSRAALLTGRYPPRTGVQFVTFPHSDWGLPSNEITIAEVLKESGYTTGMIGKWHLGHRDEFWPTNQGFDSFLGVAYSNDMKPFDLYRGKSKITTSIDQKQLSDRYANEAVKFIEANRESPFFLFYADNFPHRPLFFPDSSAGRSRAGDYGDTVETLDDAVGKVLDVLERLKLTDNSIVIFTSDNGPWFQGSSGPWRGRKGDTYDGGYRVPMLVRWPDAIRGGSTNSEMAMAIDLFPTLVNLVGASLPKDRIIDGRNILKMWTQNGQTPHEYLYFFDGNDLAAVRDTRFKLQLKDYYRTFAVPFRAYAGPRLFDLRTDPQEQYDVSMRRPAEMKRLLDQVKKMTAQTDPLKSDPGPTMPPAGVPLGPILSDR